MSDNSELIAVKEIAANGGLFQFKAGGDSRGVTDTLGGVKRWEPCFAGFLVVWSAAKPSKQSERYIVVDGHQRLDLAKRLGVRVVRCVVLYEDDGWAVARARAYGAAKNIAEGGETTDAISVAKLIRGDAHVDEWFGAVPSGRKCLKQGTAISRVSSAVFEALLSECIDPDYAAAIASGLPTEEHQLAAIRYLTKHPPSEQTRPDLLVGQIRAEGFSTNNQDTLFGILSSSHARMEYRALILEASVKHLRAVKRAFRSAVNYDDALSEVGNTLNRNINKREQAANERLADDIVQLATFPGPVSELLREAAKVYEGSNDLDSAVRTFVASVRAERRRPGRPRKIAA